jgi:hypothetical protein
MNSAFSGATSAAKLAANLALSSAKNPSCGGTRCRSDLHHAIRAERTDQRAGKSSRLPTVRPHDAPRRVDAARQRASRRNSAKSRGVGCGDREHRAQRQAQSAVNIARHDAARGRQHPAPGNAQFRKERPDVRIQLFDADLPTLIQMVEAGKLDMSLGMGTHTSRRAYLTLSDGH